MTDRKRIALIAVDTLLAAYLVLAVTAFNRPDDQGAVCSEVKIDIAEGIGPGFLTPDGVKLLLQRASIYPLAQPVQAIDTRRIEEQLLSSPYVDRVECYKTAGDRDTRVCIDLVQRVPVLRVMSDAGDDYYVDNRGGIVAQGRLASNLIVATGHVTKRYASEVLAPLVLQLVADRFWNSQVEQLHVLADGTLEMIPRVGDHVIYLGAPTGIAKKLERLTKFYKYGLSQTGWTRYSRISVEFDNQIICKKHNSIHTKR